ncbi:NhaA family Na+:H+ antiporter [Algoriphagus ratkowskyi]|uniref:Na(+)/H(+) antiporter NhaA n=1 Tax=Algoriphagus ratkowskyi TaxID=57028 RepID=A0A2W7QSF0_9BACT|nr:Na+/H+ antiporter NhaA [Algoriphagus ratkowskyi]PZX51528.1 NhaA family Na+:H+ antiporter [Algoriphagus ratkowskyi]TXD78810.1 Na+/H+ antiporter NhaA [Algoriphagus ratkowskyi]
MTTRISKTLNNLFRNQSASGIAIFLAVVVAMLLANSPFKGLYQSLIHTEISLGIGEFFISESIILWINDGLMAIFFLQVGLELKREIIGGKLSSFKKAILPIGAAIGGMVVPAVIYLIFNFNSATEQGWGIPMATDIAFAIGVLALFGNRIPVGLKVFLIALAIVDDLGAVLVIAIFYTSGISYMDLLNGVLFFLVLVGGSYIGIRKAWFYALVGIGGVWLAFFFSGVHPTIAGILTAFAIPGKVKIKEEDYLMNLQKLHLQFLETESIRGSFISEKQLNILEEIKQKTNDAETPLQKIEHQLAPIVGFFILPLFALVNTGIHIHGDSIEIISHPVSLGIGFGLLVGKFTGIMGASWLLVKLKIAELQEGVSWMHLCGVATIAGIGFTMSLFITELAFASEEYVFIAKLSILFTSLLAGVVGGLILWYSSKKIHSSSTHTDNSQ